MDFQPLKQYLDHLTSWRIPWADCLILYRNEPVFRYRTGYADLEKRAPIAEDAIFNLYSMTKIMTCAAALQLVERGRLLLSDPISEYMPEFKEMTVKRERDGETTFERAKRPIAVRDLFVMTAGFTYDLSTPSIREAVERADGRPTTRDIARAIAKDPLAFEPGTRWNYSLCHDVLGALIEAVDGRSFGAYLREEIIEPLGMKDTGFALSDEQAGRLVPQYAYDDRLGEAVRDDVNGYRLGSDRFESGGAGLYSTVDDYALFLNALTNRGTNGDGARILSPAAVELMRTDHLTEATRGDYAWDHLAGYGYGLGVRTHIAPARSGLLSPWGEFGWSGAAGCMAVIDPDQQVTVMYAQHLLNSQEPYVHPRLRNIIYACLQS
ncbi:beta-lactamase family protein [Paenibacillus sp. TRM 82003]|nr:beta-lactamase family protein [Paenibacillus sp. TRM 82003]